MERGPTDILLVEDDPGQARLAQRTLRRAGLECTWVDSAAACQAHVRSRLPAAVLLDRGLPDGDGLELLAALREESPDLCVIMLTGADDVTIAVRAIRAGASDYVLKRPDLSHLDDLPRVVERNLERLQLREERRQLDAAVRASEERYRELFDNASDLIVVCDNAGVVQRVNGAFEALTGHSPSTAEGRPLAIFVSANSPTPAEALRERVLSAGGSPVTAEVHLKAGDGHPVVVEMRARPIVESGATCGFQAVGRDVTEKRRMEEMKADFLAMVTHDMKNPVSVIVGYTEILLNDVCPASTCRDMLVSVDASARGLLHLILNFLDLSRIEAGALRLNRVATCLNDILRQVIDYEAPLARAKQIRIEEEFGPVPPVNGDRLQLDRVFVNLIGNAIKFTPPGGRVAVSSTAENGSVVIRVSDTGPGIPPHQIPHLFGKYQRLSQTAQTDGTGLGLFIAKSMVDAHGGAVRVESAPGTGATFVVSLPATVQ
jgi:PAS domain S-box-containing protein